MKRICRMCQSFYKNAWVKHKWKTYWLYFTDDEYYQQINHLAFLTKHYNSIQFQEIPIHLLCSGHKVVYPEWIEKLEKKYIQKQIQPSLLRIINDGPIYRVVDGNHRLKPLLKWAAHQNKISLVCEVMVHFDEKVKKAL